jgi:hypothetical protein
MRALIGVKVELFLGDLLPGVFDPAPLGLLQVFLGQVELGAFVFYQNQCLKPSTYKLLLHGARPGKSGPAVRVASASGAP